MKNKKYHTVRTIPKLNIKFYTNTSRKLLLYVRYMNDSV